jgi:hypothetical protein
MKLSEILFESDVYRLDSDKIKSFGGSLRTYHHSPSEVSSLILILISSTEYDSNSSVASFIITPLYRHLFQTVQRHLQFRRLFQ